MTRPSDRTRGVHGRAAARKARAIRHYEALASHYDQFVSRKGLGLLRRLERAAVLRLARLDEPGRGTVIDVGCGSGFYARAAKRAGRWVHAVDAAPGMVERVRSDVDLAEVADLEAFAAGRRYDLVVCCGALEFAADPALAFDRLCALLAPRARLVVLVPRRGPGGALYWLEKRLAGLSVVLYTRDELVRWAAANGLTLAAEAYPLPTNMVLAFQAGARRAPTPRRPA